MNSNLQNSILRTENLSIGYSKKKGDLLIAEGLNLELKSGQVMTVLGKNGSGKSTLIRTLIRGQKCLKGEIFIKNKSIDAYSPINFSQNISVVLTEKLPENLLSVYELIAMGRQVHTDWLDRLTPIDIEKIDFAIEATNVGSFLHKKFRELSDGQQQKTLIARAIAQDTPLIFLDEPTAHLDIHHKMETFLLLRELAHRQNKSILMATHEVGLAVQVADEICLLHNRSALMGSPEKLIKNKVISRVFDSELVKFHPQKATFEFKKEL